MSAPGAPRITAWPNILDGEIRLYWEPPLSDGGSPITKYTVTCTAISLIQDVSANRLDTLITGLTNQVDYVFEVTATNAAGTSPAVAFPPLQTGAKTFGPSIATASTLNTSTALLSWTPSTVAGEGAPRAFLITCLPSTTAISSFYLTQYPHKSTMAVAGLSTNVYYQFLVRGVNDVGYCPPFAYTSTLGFGVVSTPVGGFSPSSITALRLWVDAQDAAYASTTGVSTLVRVTDKSSNAYVFSNATGFGRTPSSFNTAYTSFTSPGTNTSIGSNASFAISQPYTVFFVGRNTKPLTNFSMVYSATPNNTGATFVNNNDRYSMYAGTQVDSLSIAGTGQSNILLCASYSTTNSFFAQNGSTIVTGFNAGSSNITGGLGLGQHTSVNGLSFGGQWCELIIYSNVMIPYDRQRVEGYLAWKWGLQSNLPAIHPFRSNAPTSN
jgi:hypothetical protein